VTLQIINFSTSNNIVIMYYKYNIISFKIKKNEPDNDDTLSNFSPILENIKRRQIVDILASQKA
jgi:hypothetical protein